MNDSWNAVATAMNTPAQRRLSPLLVALWLFVIFASVFDGYLALLHRDSLPVDERNPLGRALIELNGGRVWYLLTAKLLGTVAAASLILLTYVHHPRLGMTATVVVACLQLYLLMYLLLA
jgi:hypothetical protein